MQNGYKVIWSDEALQNLIKIIDYLDSQWTKKELSKFVEKLDKRITLISENPQIFPASRIQERIRKSVLTKQISIYYQINKNSVGIITLFDNRSNPNKIKFNKS